MIDNHLQMLIDLSDDFEQALYEEAKSVSTSPLGAIKWLNKMRSALPDAYSGSRDEVIKYTLGYKEFDDVAKRIREEALSRGWED
ncbi:hypothetical protein LOB47_05380 [Lactobacillus delbrueckii subsp. lactis]|uniref:hypothetical protein n=1 Tax=Lactobacillus delbrueckii TaxID=1584 RepID=UPI001E3CFEEC|nr:hypothetical protein [Lactobacillus delbrueckii]MCD5606244.1 hypothetical protein [Lactobacillus delbrueckii subsp. lactis]